MEWQKEKNSNEIETKKIEIEIKAEAALRGISMAELIRQAVEEWLENHPRTEKERTYGSK